jgi:hypothetical protein
VTEDTLSVNGPLDGHVNSAACVLLSMHCTVNWDPAGGLQAAPLDPSAQMTFTPLWIPTIVHVTASVQVHLLVNLTWSNAKPAKHPGNLSYQCQFTFVYIFMGRG